MRVLRLEFGDDVGSLDVHPLVTVVHGVGAALRPRLETAVRALARGEDPGVGGLVENDGLLIELTPGTPAPTGPPVLGDVVIDADHPPADRVQDLPALRARHDQLSKQADVDAARLEEVRAQLDPEAAARLAARDDEPTGSPTAPDPGARAALAAALAAWSHITPTVRVQPAWAAELAHQWQQHQHQAATGASRMAALDRQVDAASRSVADAIAALAQAESMAEPVLLTEDEDDRLAELATRPVSRARRRPARARADDEEAEIAALLAKVGQPTYAAYVMYRLAPTASPAQHAAIVAARAGVAEAEAGLALARRARDEDPELTEHRRRQRELQEAAAEHLGPLLPDDLGRLLRSLGEEGPNPAWHTARRQVVAVAARHGFDCPGDLDGEALADHLQRQLDGIDPGRGPDPVPVPVPGSEVDHGLERRAARHHRALDRLADLERRADHSRLLAADLQERIAAVGQPPASTVGAIVAAVDRAVAEVNASGRAGAAPVVIAGSLRALPPGGVQDLLDRLELEAERVQLIVVTEHPEAGAWAQGVGLRRALQASTRARSGPADDGTGLVE